jgi:hypothetical protein
VIILEFVCSQLLSFFQVFGMLFDSLLAALEQELRADFHKALAGLLATARTRLEGALAEVAKERAHGLAEVATNKAELRREIEAMQTHQEKQQGRVELNIGGHRFATSVHTLRRLPHTFFDAYFSGRYAQDVCNDGSIFVDRDGEHFGHILEYMRNGVVSVAEAGARPSVSLLRALKREFGYYCIELVADPVEPEHPEMVYIMGGEGDQGVMSSMERYDAAASGQWSTMASMNNARHSFSACVIMDEIYVIGGLDADIRELRSVEKYSPSSNSWTAVAHMPEDKVDAFAVCVGSAMYVVGGFDESTLKYDSAHDTWSTVATMPHPRSSCAACVVGNEIYVFGGINNEQAEQASVYKFDTVADGWSILAPMPLACTGASASVMKGHIYIVGAGGEVSGCMVLRFDVSSGAWSTIAPTLSSQTYGASFVLGGCLYAGSSRGVERYDAATNTWTAVANMPEERSDFRAVVIGSAGLAEEQDLFDSLIAKAVGSAIEL